MIVIMSPRVALLDSNAVHFLVRPPAHIAVDPASAQAALATAVDDGKLEVLATWPLLQELYLTHETDPEKAAHMIDLVQRLSGGLILRQRIDRTAEEVLLRGAIGKADARRPGGTLWARLRRGDRVAEVATIVRERKDEHVRDMTERRQRTIDRFGGVEEAREAIANSPSLHEACVEDWARGYMRGERKRLGLGHDESSWPHPREIPSLWNAYNYGIANMLRQVGEGIDPDPSDPGDFDHYSDVGYADVLVTQDGPFRQLWGRIPGKGKIRVLRLMPFLRELGIVV